MRRFAVLACWLALAPLVAVAQATPTASPAPTYANGDAFALVPAGPPGAVAVVLVGPYRAEPYGSQLPLIVRNNTAAPVTFVTVYATIRTPDGTPVATNPESLFSPGIVPPGEVAIGEVGFDVDPPPPGATQDFTVVFEPVADSAYAPNHHFKVTEATRVGHRIVGALTNLGPGSSLFPRVDVMCFAGAAITGLVSAYLDHAPPPGASARFGVDPDVPCERYIVAVS